MQQTRNNRHLFTFVLSVLSISGAYFLFFTSLQTKIREFQIKNIFAPAFSQKRQAELKSNISKYKALLANNNIAYDETVWPTDSHSVSLPFGPYLQDAKKYQYDFHGGIDIPGKSGVDKVYAIADGKIFRTYRKGARNNPYKDGGAIIVVRHTADKAIPLHEKSFKTYYSIYMHLDKILVDMVNKGGPYPKILKGQTIGIVGKPGVNKSGYLHFEIRVGTSCPEEYQRAHPSSSCVKISENPKDPSVNPSLFLK